MGADDVFGDPDLEAWLPPARAPVVPRVRAPGGGATQPLEAVVRRVLATGARGGILVYGRPGGGKTTALRHLRAVLPPTAVVHYFDEPAPEDVSRLTDALSIVTTCERIPGRWLFELELAPWCEDDWIEYAVARRRDQCASVLERLKKDPARELLKGSPQLWHIALDRLAADERVADTAAALREHLSGVLPAGALRDRIGSMCARVLVDPEHPIRLSDLPEDLPTYAIKLLRHRAVRVLLGADHICQSIAAGGPLKALDLSEPLPAELVRETAAALRRLPQAVARLERILAGADRNWDAATATLLLAMDPKWRPRDGRGLKLVRAHLGGAKWAGVDLRSAELMLADLHDADLAGARLTSAWVGGADLRGATLAGANLRWLHGANADLSGAELTGACLISGQLLDADLCDADLSGADLSMAVLSRANLRAARLVNANLRQAVIHHAKVDDAELIGTRFDSARLSQVCFTAAANVSGVSFKQATLHRCVLEDLRLPGCDFSDADLTGSYFTNSFIRNGDFRRAHLNDTGLAEIDWEGADLRDADLRGCTFHMGSTRSGLVGSTVPCEGSRTGFYTDDFNDRDFKDPEEIRKANLCRADLRGANIEGVDFYLVDLRGARYTPEQEEQFARCGAILHSRVA